MGASETPESCQLMGSGFSARLRDSMVFSDALCDPLVWNLFGTSQLRVLSVTVPHDVACHI